MPFKTTTKARQTAHRARLLAFFQSRPGLHLSAEEVLASLRANGDDISLATVYRLLAQFEASGWLQRHEFEQGHAVFEFDPGEHHDHLICLDCGQIREFCDPMIESLQEQRATQSGLQLRHHTMVLYGTCAQGSQCPSYPTESSAR